MKQKLTISVNKDLLRRARTLAARRGTSVSRLLAEELERLVTIAGVYGASRRQALAFLKQGLHLGSDGIANRDALHDRPGLR